MLGGFLSEQFYAVAGIVDANGDASDLIGGFDTFFNDFEMFKSLEFGWTSSQERLFLDNAHITFWQIDERDEAGTADDWGVNFSLSRDLLGVGFNWSRPNRDTFGVKLDDQYTLEVFQRWLVSSIFSAAD